MSPIKKRPGVYLHLEKSTLNKRIHSATLANVTRKQMPRVHLHLELPEDIANGTRHKMPRVYLHLESMPSKCMQSNARNEHTVPQNATLGSTQVKCE